MPGVVAKFEHGPLTCAVSGTVTGGQLIEAHTGSKVRTAPAGSAKVLGVALFDAVETDASTGTTSYGAAFVDASFPGPYVSVATCGVFKLTFAANAGFGATLKSAASGQVTPWVSGTDAADLIIGRCVEPAGATSAGKGLVQLYLG
ncbi:hypothetical protein ACIBSV_46770 [Embleya sp. NPDC050154]|uniref:hypothetical protein n=1 Tax=Embleya sp. NPDC050154 TaxID=3363988 RepID=UPI00378A2982